MPESNNFIFGRVCVCVCVCGGGGASPLTQGREVSILEKKSYQYAPCHLTLCTFEGQVQGQPYFNPVLGKKSDQNICAIEE